MQEAGSGVRCKGLGVGSWSVGNEKPLTVLSRELRGQSCDVWTGMKLEAETGKGGAVTVERRC